MAKAKEVATFGSERDEIAAELANKMLALADDTGTDVLPADAITIDIAARIMHQESVDDILGMGDSAAAAAGQFIDRPFVILEAPKWLKAKESFAANGPGVFVVLTIGMQDDSTVQTVTCGGTNVLTQLLRANELGTPTFGDQVMRFVERETNAGYKVLWLAKALQSAN